MSQGENLYLPLPDCESIERDVSRRSKRNNEFPNIALDAPPHERMCREILDRTANRRRRGNRCCRVRLNQLRDRALDLIRRARRINYFRHGFGLGLATPCASRSIQACTSSAR